MTIDTSVVSLSEYFGFDPRSPYAELFTNIYNLTKPAVVDHGDIEDGEIGDDEDQEKDEEVSLEEEPQEDTSDEIEESGMDLTTDKSKEPDSAADNTKKFSKDILHWNPHNLNQNFWNGKILPPAPPVKVPFSSHLPPPPIPSLPPQLPLSLPGAPAPHQFNSGIMTSAGLPSIPFPFPLRFPPTLNPPHWPNPFFLPPPTLPPVSQPQQSILQELPPANNIPLDEKEFQESKGFDLKVLFDMDPSPLRITWLMKYMDFMSSKGTPVSQCPSMYKVRFLKSNFQKKVSISVLQEPLDLFKLYTAVTAEGGFNKCSANKSWKNVSVKMTKNFRQSFLWRLLQKQYRKYLLQYELHDQQVCLENQQKQTYQDNNVSVLNQPKGRKKTKKAQ